VVSPDSEIPHLTGSERQTSSPTSASDHQRGASPVSSLSTSCIYGSHARWRRLAVAISEAPRFLRGGGGSQVRLRRRSPVHSDLAFDPHLRGKVGLVTRQEQGKGGSVAGANGRLVVSSSGGHPSGGGRTAMRGAARSVERCR
jgi:hypothetical protein